MSIEIIKARCTICSKQTLPTMLCTCPQRQKDETWKEDTRTLEELIEACGEELTEIRQNPGNYAPYCKWEAYGPSDQDGSGLISPGSTPKEAVKKLLDSLNKPLGTYKLPPGASDCGDGTCGDDTCVRCGK